MEKDIIINIHLEGDFPLHPFSHSQIDSFAPKMVIEDAVNSSNQVAAAFSFVPQFKLDTLPCEFIFIADRSGSMEEGQKMGNLKSSLQLFLRFILFHILFAHHLQISASRLLLQHYQFWNFFSKSISNKF